MADGLRAMLSDRLKADPRVVATPMHRPLAGLPEDEEVVKDRKAIELVRARDPTRIDLLLPHARVWRDEEEEDGDEKLTQAIHRLVDAGLARHGRGRGERYVPRSPVPRPPAPWPRVRPRQLVGLPPLILLLSLTQTALDKKQKYRYLCLRSCFFSFFPFAGFCIGGYKGNAPL